MREQEVTCKAPAMSPASAAFPAQTFLAWRHWICAGLGRLCRHITISKVEFHQIGASCMSDSVFSPCATCCFSNSEVFGGPCLKCPTTLQHLQSAPSNGIFCGYTVTCWILCSMHGKCLNGRCLVAAIIFLASVLRVLTVFSMFHCFA